MSKKDGGQAFPVSTCEVGMTLRDYFAAQAMAHVSWYVSDMAPSAALCYKAADAMLAARAK